MKHGAYVLLSPDRELRAAGLFALRKNSICIVTYLIQRAPLIPRQCVMNWKHLGTYLSHQRDQSAATGHFQLAKHGVEMCFYRFETQAAFIGNLLIAAAVAY